MQTMISGVDENVVKCLVTVGHPGDSYAGQSQGPRDTKKDQLWADTAHAIF